MRCALIFTISLLRDDQLRLHRIAGRFGSAGPALYVKKGDMPRQRTLVRPDVSECEHASLVWALRAQQHLCTRVGRSLDFAWYASSTRESNETHEGWCGCILAAGFSRSLTALTVRRVHT